MFKNQDYSLIEIGSLKTSEDVFYYLFIFLFLPVGNVILFSVPLYFILKLKNVVYVLLLVLAIVIAEYFLYTYFASQENRMNGVYLGIINLLLLYLIFFRHIEKQTPLFFNRKS
jgi:hypothetical protein